MLEKSEHSPFADSVEVTALADASPVEPCLARVAPDPLLLVRGNDRLAFYAQTIFACRTCVVLVAFAAAVVLPVPVLLRWLSLCIVIGGAHRVRRLLGLRSAGTASSAGHGADVAGSAEDGAGRV